MRANPTGLRRAATATILLLSVAAPDGAPTAPAAHADVPEEFPARFDERMTYRIVAIARAGSRSETRRRRGASDDVLVFDDAERLHFEGDVEAPFPVEATWHAPSPRTVVFRYTPETMEAVRAWAVDLIGFSGKVRLRVGAGRLRFSRDGTTYTGSQTLRIRLRRGIVTVDATEWVRYRGARTAPP